MKIEVQIGICLYRRVSRLVRMFCGTYVPSKRCFNKFAEIGPKKSAPECPFECEEGVQKLFGQCPGHQFERGFPNNEMKM